ncbi:MAG: TetR/AcrR family transcriptional regulator [Alphaproteobacteria bacterium]|nr:TetR/AcrR family transcriptional regulator [Alphaproteobacteria bacterium]
MANRDIEALKERKKPTQERSRALVDAVLEAAARIVVAEGLDALTVPALCDVAGVSPGSFYQYFPHKEAVLYALLRRHAEDVTARMLEVLARAPSTPTPALVAAAVDAFLAAHRVDPALHALLGRVVASEAGPGLEDDLLQRFELGLVALMRARPAELRDRDPEVLAFLVIRTLEGVVHAAARDRAGLLATPAFREGLVTQLLAVLA